MLQICNKYFNIYYHSVQFWILNIRHLNLQVFSKGIIWIYYGLPWNLTYLYPFGQSACPSFPGKRLLIISGWFVYWPQTRSVKNTCQADCCPWSRFIDSECTHTDPRIAESYYQVKLVEHGIGIQIDWERVSMNDWTD